MASKSRNINAYSDCRTAFELASRDGHAKRLCASKGQAIHYRQRLYQFRGLLVEQLADVYRARPETFEKVGTTPFDDIQCRLVELKPPAVVAGESFPWAVEMNRVQHGPLISAAGDVIVDESPTEELLG